MIETGGVKLDEFHIGDPATRDPEQVATDVADGLYTREIAERDYRVALTASGSVDRARTAQLRTMYAAE